MTISELIYIVQELGVKSVRLDSDVRGFINRAQRQIAQRRNWSFMHAQQPFSVPGTTIALTSNTAATASVVTCAAHSLTTGQLYTGTIASVSGSIPTINGERTITILGATSFSVPVTTTTGGTGGTIALRSVSLGGTFKQLSGERSPVSYQDPTSSSPFPIPVQVVSRPAADRTATVPYSNAQPTAYPIQSVYLEQNGPGGQWALYLPAQYAPTPITFQVSAYYYPADLTLGTDHNALTDHGDLCEALVNLAKARAYFAEEVDSPKGTAALALYEQAYKSASYSDVAQGFGGRQLRM